jgi:hypothetical protein
VHVDPPTEPPPPEPIARRALARVAALRGEREPDDPTAAIEAALGAGAVTAELAGPDAVETAEQLEAQGLAVYELQPGGLAPFRPLGAPDEPIKVFALSPAAAERLRDAGLLRERA